MPLGRSSQSIGQLGQNWRPALGHNLNERGERACRLVQIECFTELLCAGNRSPMLNLGFFGERALKLEYAAVKGQNLLRPWAAFAQLNGPVNALRPGCVAP